MAWFRQWQLFARGVTTDEPGPVDNKSIAVPGENTIPLRSVRPGSDYAQINSTLWHFFHGIYGGGPEIVLRGQPVPPPEAKPTKSVKVCILLLSNVFFIDFLYFPKEREPEPMDIGEQPQPSSKLPAVNSSAQETLPEVHVDAPSNNAVSQKPQKSVSFEDNESYMDNAANHNESLRSVQMKRKQAKQQKEQSKESKKTEADNTDGIVTYLRRKQLKHQQQISQDVSNEKHHSEMLDIRGKKDKRRAGMKASGLFGVEGMWWIL